MDIVFCFCFVFIFGGGWGELISQTQKVNSQRHNGGGEGGVELLYFIS